MSKIKDIKELREFILKLEDKYDLLNFEIDGVKPWQLMRVSIDYDLGKIAGIMETPHSKLTLKHKVVNAYSLIKSFLFYNPFLASKANIIVFSYPRVKKVNNEYIDIYTHYFINELLEKNENFIEIETPFLGKHLTNKKDYKYYLDFFMISRKLFSRFITIRDKKLDKIKKIEKEIEQKIGKYDLNSLFLKTVKMYKIEYFLYSKLFSKLKPKKIYVVVSYSFGSMIKAAKDLGIETIEFQHGNFSKFHFGYYFGEDKKNLDYFPDKFYVWNEYWKNRINFPIADENVVVKKFDYLENRKKLYSNKKIDNQAVVLSQGVFGDILAKKILDNWDYFKRFDLIYKLHPGEYERYKKYKNLMRLEKEFNIKIVKDIDLYELFSTSEYQIGVFSTAIYEGVEFGCKTILLDLPGIEEMDKFIELNDLMQMDDMFVSKSIISKNIKNL
jgi:hypothetical protein